MKKLLLLLLLSLGLIGSSWSDSNQVINVEDELIIEYPIPTRIVKEILVPILVCETDELTPIEIEMLKEVSIVKPDVMDEVMELDHKEEIDNIVIPVYVYEHVFVYVRGASDDPICIERKKEQAQRDAERLKRTQVCLDEVEQQFNNRLLELEIERSELQACSEGDSSATRLACKFSLLLFDSDNELGKIRDEYNYEFMDCHGLHDIVD